MTHTAFYTGDDDDDDDAVITEDQALGGDMEMGEDDFHDLLASERA